jgi:hypothetical protein
MNLSYVVPAREQLQEDNHSQRGIGDGEDEVRACDDQEAAECLALMGLFLCILCCVGRGVFCNWNGGDSNDGSDGRR